MAVTKATDKQGKAIKTKMQEIRTCLPYEVDDARLRVKQLSDWKHHYRKHPFAILAIAMAAGYILVPHRQSSQSVVIYRDRTERDGDANASVPKAAEKGLMGGILGAITTMALRQGLNLAAAKIGQRFSGGPQASSIHSNASSKYEHSQHWSADQ